MDEVQKQKFPIVYWVVIGLVVLVLMSISANVWQFKHKPKPEVINNPPVTNYVFTNSISSSKPKPSYLPSLNNAVLVLKTNENGTFDTNVLVVMSIDEYGRMVGQVIDASNYYVSDITSTIEGDRLIDIHYKNTNIWKLPANLLKKIMYEPRNNIICVGYSVCGRLLASYDRLNLLDFDKFGVGVGVWSTWNLMETYRLWDMGVKVNVAIGDR